jgi:hypothetical protein
MILFCMPMIFRTLRTPAFWWGFILGAIVAGLVLRFVG